MTCERSVVFSGSSTNKTDLHDITEILLKVAINTIKQANTNLRIHEKTFVVPNHENWYSRIKFYPFSLYIDTENKCVLLKTKCLFYCIMQTCHMQICIFLSFNNLVTIRIQIRVLIMLSLKYPNAFLICMICGKRKRL